MPGEDLEGIGRDEMLTWNIYITISSISSSEQSILKPPESDCGKNNIRKGEGKKGSGIWVWSDRSHICLSFPTHICKTFSKLPFIIMCSSLFHQLWASAADLSCAQHMYGGCIVPGPITLWPPMRSGVQHGSLNSPHLFLQFVICDYLTVAQEWGCMLCREVVRIES